MELTKAELTGTNFLEAELENVELTPAQLAFLEASIPRFDIAEWNARLAGQAASTRRYLRVSNATHSYILVEWDSADEDWPRFLGIEAYLSPFVPFLPKIFASDPVHGLILEEDLGDITLKRFCVDRVGHNALIEEAYRKIINNLIVWHGQDVANCPFIVPRSMDVETFFWETTYFSRHCVVEFFAKERLLTENWEKERRKMAVHAAALPTVCIHRDFQSENIMIANGHIKFVDYQGARLGPSHYDAASLIFDPYVNLGQEMMNRLVDYYLTKINHVSAKNDFYVCAAQRLMQALGAYANLSLHKDKPRYREFIPTALDRLHYVMRFLPDYPAIAEVVYGCQ